MSLPPTLLAELRSAFKGCVRHRVPQSRSLLHVSHRAQKSLDQSKQKHAPKSPARAANDDDPNNDFEEQDLNQLTPDSSSKELVPRDRGSRSVGSGRHVNVPQKVVPKAELTPNVRLTPRERLHIEILTRRTPRTVEKKTYKEKLLIYHQGIGRETALIFSKTFSFAGLTLNSLIFVPALWVAGTSPWICGACLLAGFLPISLVHALTAPMVNRIYLHLPTRARQSPQAAMEYARNLPSTAMLDIEYLRPIPLAGMVLAHLADLEISKTRWRPATFQWKEHKAVTSGSWLWPQPVEFFVKPQSHKGKAARFIVPGIWPNVYKRLTGQESIAVNRWKR